MDIKRMIEMHYRANEYDYYRELGYGEKAATVMAALNYGNLYTSTFVKFFPAEGRLDRIYDWLIGMEDPVFDVDPWPLLDLCLGDFIKEHLSELPENDQAELRRYFFPDKEENEQSLNPNMVGAGFGGMSGMGGAGFGGMSGMVGAGFGGMSGLGGAGFGGMTGFGGMSGLGKVGFGMNGMAMVGPGLSDASTDFPGVVMQPSPTDSYESIEEKDARSVLTAPTSTFRMTTSTASAGILLNQVRYDRNIIRDQVRIEEVLNYFDYDFPETWKMNSTDSAENASTADSANGSENASTANSTNSADAPRFTIHTELSDKGEDRKLLMVYVEADDTPAEKQNIVLLIDASGSMESNSCDTFETMATIVSKLHEGDVLSVVTYSDSDHTVLANHVVGGRNDLEDLMGIILTIRIDGSTNGSAGIETAYAIGEKTRQSGWSNQVILMTDGDLNFGITSRGGLEELIEEKKQTGMFLSVIGTGLTNYMDDRLAALAKHGNGTYVVANDLFDVKRSINEKYISLTNIIAKDVKAQVEFNPKFVRKYRLLGFENRELIHEDFKNDAVISEPYGSGSHCVALYELYMGNAIENPSDDLRYTRLSPNDLEELGTVSVRYKLPDSDTSEEVKKVIPVETFATDNSLRARFLYCLCEVLRMSDKMASDDYEFLLDMMEGEKFRKLFDSNVVDDLAKLVSVLDLKRIDVSYHNRLEEERRLRAKQEGEQTETSTGSSSNISVSPAERTPLNNRGEWKCGICGSQEGNTGNFCSCCGAKRPEDVWKCGICGNLSTGNFCDYCGNPKG